MRLRNRLFAVIAACALGAPAVAAGPAPEVLAAVWKGEWTSPEGHLYHAESHWEASKDGAVEGYLLWTLKRSPKSDDQAKLGLKGKEFVRGRFSPDCGVLSLEGYKTDDPHKILGRDKYRLILSEDQRVLTGPTRHGGNWRGVLTLRR